MQYGSEIKIKEEPECHKGGLIILKFMYQT